MRVNCSIPAKNSPFTQAKPQFRALYMEGGGIMRVNCSIPAKNPLFAQAKPPFRALYMEEEAHDR
jgi:hypothetical protein